MYRKIVASLGLAALLVVPGLAFALGLGEIEIHSALNQPMDAEIELVGFKADEIDELKVELANQQVFERVGIPRPYILTRLKFTPAVSAGKPIIRVTSTDSVREPFLTFLIDVRWSKGKLLREYTVLLDPPVFGGQAKATVQKPTVAAPAPVPTAPKTVASKPKPVPKQPAPIVAKPTPIKPPAPKLKPSLPPTVSDSSPPEDETDQSMKTRRGDTLWSIAERYAQTSGVSVNQMMLAIQEANPNGFGKDNINNLKAGVILRIPAAEAARRLSRQEAIAEVKRQWQVWQQGRQLADTDDSAISVDTGDAIVEAEPATDKTDVATPKADEDSSSSKLSILGDDEVVEGMSGEDAAANAEQLRKQIALLKESTESKAQQNAELSDRIQALESMLKKQEDIISLQNEQLAQLQNTVASSAENELSTEVPADVVADAEEAAVAEQPAEQASDLLAEAEVETAESGVIAPATVEPLPDFSGPIPEEFLAADSAAETESASVEETPAEPDAEEAAVEEPVVAGPSLMDSIMGFVKEQSQNLVYAGGALLAGLIGWMFIRRRREQSQAGLVAARGLPAFDDEESTEDLLEDTVIATPDRVDQALDELEELEDEDDSQIAMGDSSSADSDEVLEEADVYISYGLFQQAEDLLKEAIAKDPASLEYQAKLAEVYHGDNRSEDFVAHVESIESNMDKGSPEWSKIATMGAVLAPAHALFADGADTAANASNSNSNSAMPASVDTDLAIDEDDIEDLVDDDLDDNSLDFTFGEDSNNDEDVADGGTEELQAFSTPSAPIALDTGLEQELEAGSDSDDAEDDDDSFSDELEEAVEAAVQDDEDNDAALEFDTSLIEDELASGSDTEMLDDSELDVENELADILDLDPEEDMGNSSIEPDLNTGAGDLNAEDDGAETAIFDSALFESESVESVSNEEDTVSLEEVQENLTAELETLSFDNDDLDPNDLEEASLPTLQTEELSKREISDDIDEMDNNLAASETGTFEADMLAENVTEQFDIGDIDTEMVDLGNFGDDDDLDPPSVIEEVGTKLDLAKAFVDMGDEDAAKETLTEVIEQGDQTQIREAKDLLDKLT